MPKRAEPVIGKAAIGEWYKKLVARSAVPTIVDSKP
jgi:hypothetical protein